MWVLTVFGETYNSLAMAREQQDAIAFGQIERAFQCPVSGAGSPSASRAIALSRNDRAPRQR